MHIIGWIIIGLIAGGIARFFSSKKDNMGCIFTIILGIIGSFVGGFISNFFWHFGRSTTFHPGGIIMSIIGAMVVLFIWHQIEGA
ncbi:MAG TPA: GlsB/YeaQ/YmgE family stress response membrane protein [Blastocatellia bacterium]